MTLLNLTCDSDRFLTFSDLKKQQIFSCLN